jgi:hypothetical protein
MATKNELLATAKTLNIAGRHDMDKATLEVAIQTEIDRLTAIAVAEVNKPKTRTSAPRRIRTGNSGNLPYQPKQYALREIHLEGACKQIRGIFSFMQAHDLLEINGRSLSGPTIAQGAVDEGYLTTKSDPAVIFAYYAREMERRGLVFVGYDYDSIDLEDDYSDDEDDMDMAA